MQRPRDKADRSIELKSRLDALPPTTNSLWTHFSYPVEARATHELARRLLRGDVKTLHLYAYGQTGIGLPTEELGSLIYVPKAVLEIDMESRAKGRQNGISLTSEDDKNVFLYTPISDSAAVKKLLDYVWTGGCESHVGKLARLRTDRRYQLAMARYAIKFLIRIKLRNDLYLRKFDFTPDRRELNMLTKELILMYASEMDVKLS
jgi:hypothetical protein